ncbi:hypothetical protein V5799_011305 [Amblyomma americanum]|uniref:Hexosyltransferase n=1 Tax=Amblyomma americanum TaxID=6943 RepID=A0AAQ4EIA0_AMBAM
MAYALILVLGSLALHRTSFYSAVFKGCQGVINVVVNAHETSATTLLNAVPTSPGVSLDVRPVSVSSSTRVPDATTAENKRPVPGWKVRSACRSTLRVLFYVNTDPRHADMRRLLRDTVGDPVIAEFLNSSLVFFVGQTADKKLRSTLQAEAGVEGDMVQLDFLDTYRNLTHKFIGATKWLRENGCLNSTEVVVKIDDDVMVNVFHLATYISALPAAGSPSFRSIHCCPSSTPIVDRGIVSKWYVTKEEYPDDMYPPYCPGAFVIMRASVLAHMCEAIERVRFFWIDDVYATGLLRHATNVSLVPLTGRCNLLPSIYTMVMNKELFLHMGYQPALFTRAKQIWKSVMRSGKKRLKGRKEVNRKYKPVRCVSC